MTSSKETLQRNMSIAVLIGHLTLCAQVVVQLFTRKAAQLLYSNQRLQRWCFDVELLFLAQLLGVPTVETSVTWMEIPGQLLLL